MDRRSWLRPCSLSHLCSLENVLESHQVAVTLTRFCSCRAAALGHPSLSLGSCKGAFPRRQALENCLVVSALLPLHPPSHMPQGSASVCTLHFPGDISFIFLLP